MYKRDKSVIYFVKNMKLKAKDAGQFYWAPYDKWLRSKDIIQKGAIGVLIKESLSQDINTKLDWNKAISKYKFMRKYL